MPAETSITKTALDELGLKCYHMTEVLDKGASEAQHWIDAYEGKPVDWQLIFKDYQASLSTMRYASLSFKSGIV